ncbi:hypothetical protein [Curtobacterium sp. MCBD17_040]|uniref:hypothetical protein n=1 Tax=Curtobacterium sp. MCBD17_040 TaxID=2175674 RepID=UPI000DA7AFBC|nr:hypothetical protein [Curtobacterium sp. MCBD17_040]WIB65502.1 hypothetical protein DEI94_19200 [Curtobacterium sp. MCBD17_040]
MTASTPAPPHPITVGDDVTWGMHPGIIGTVTGDAPAAGEVWVALPGRDHDEAAHRIWLRRPDTARSPHLTGA